ncbi:MAG TPA: hotdog fold thioesterase [Verrucomicrobiae bacterium]
METTEHIRKCLSQDRFAAHCGIELISVEPGCARVKMTVEPTHWNGLGTIQGGAIFTLADFAFAAASNSHGTIAVAINVNISFMKAVKTGTLWAVAREVSRSFKIANYTVEVKDDGDELVALFQGMVYRKKEPLPVE